MKKLLIAAGALLAVPGAAQAALPNPFGHACTPQNGVLFCPTATDADRVPSFDGVPMDAATRRSSSCWAATRISCDRVTSTSP